MGVEIMQGLTMARVEVACRVVTSGAPHDFADEIRFTSTCGRTFLLHHHQDCCENVCIEDIAGDVEDLVGSPILMAEEATSVAEVEHESGTWTFYKFATNKGYVTIRWLGTSNGYYSESVDFEEVE
jgi:hypothetical protein